MNDDGDGPFLTAAFFCERVLQEQDGVLSAIRMVDRVFFLTDEDGQLVEPLHRLTLLITFKSGKAQGSLSVRVEQEKPSTERGTPAELSVFFEGGERGVNLVIPTEFRPEYAGLHWFDVFVEERRATRIPLRAVFQRMPRTERAE